jgi:two-component system, NtrC family, response regulator AtoC
MPRGRVLLICSQVGEAEALRALLNPLPLQIEIAGGVHASIDRLLYQRFHAVIVAPTGEATGAKDNVPEIFRALKDGGQETPVIAIVAPGKVSLAEEYHAGGAFDVIVMPVDRHAFVSVVRRALVRSGLIFPKEKAEPAADRPIPEFPFLVGTSGPMMAVLRQIAKVATAEANVCVYGESGTGKELVARAIHYSGHRANRPMITFDCAAIPEGLMESEMFGHVKGSFTSAVADREGVFQVADGGSLFLDEIGEISLPFQAKLLRAIQYREFRKVGGKDPIKVDVRILAATNKALPGMVRAGTFREDLFYRLEVLSIVVPPLRQRKEDIPLLVGHFIQRFNRHSRKQIHGVSQKTMGALLRYGWPGNVRELENCIERAAVMSDGDTLDVEDLAQVMRPVRRPDQAPLSTPADSSVSSLKDVEREAILRALRHAEGDKVRAAELLGVSLRTLYYKLERLDEVQAPPAKTRVRGAVRRSETPNRE